MYSAAISACESAAEGAWETALELLCGMEAGADGTSFSSTLLRGSQRIWVEPSGQGGRKARGFEGIKAKSLVCSSMTGMNLRTSLCQQSTRPESVAFPRCFEIHIFSGPAASSRLRLFEVIPYNAGDAGFVGPIRAPTQKADMGRARQRTQKKQPKKSSPQARPETQMQQNTVNSSVLWLGSRARARRPENQREKSKDRAEREPATAKAKRTEQQPNAQHSSFWRYLQRFVERGPSIAGMLGSAWRQNAQK